VKSIPNARLYFYSALYLPINLNLNNDETIDMTKRVIYCYQIVEKVLAAKKAPRNTELLAKINDSIMKARL